MVTADDLRTIFLYFEMQASRKRRVTKLHKSKEQVLFFIAKMKDFMGINMVGNQENQQNWTIPNVFSAEEIKAINDLEKAVVTDGKAVNFFSNQINCTAYLSLIDREEIFDHFFEDVTDSDLISSSSSGSSGSSDSTGSPTEVNITQIGGDVSGEGNSQQAPQQA